VAASTSIQITRWSRSASRIASEPSAPPPSATNVGPRAAPTLSASALAERGLAGAGEDLADRTALAGLDLGVGVDGGAARHGRERPRQGRLAGAHEADDRDRAATAYCRSHPIRFR
jgi:hypothetical protein